MGIFDDVVVNAKSAAQTVGKMAGQFVDMSKLRINMAELNGEITKRYQELGRFIYEAKKAGSADEAELANQIAGIDDLYAQLSAVSAQYASMQDKVTCPACGRRCRRIPCSAATAAQSWRTHRQSRKKLPKQSRRPKSPQSRRRRKSQSRQRRRLSRPRKSRPRNN